MFATSSSSSVWNWIESTTIIPDHQQQSSNTTTTTVAITNNTTTRTPTPPSGATKSTSSVLSNNNNNRHHHHHHHAATQQQQQQSNNNKPTNNNNNNKPTNDVSEFWRKQMEIIVRLSREFTNNDDDDEQKVTTTTNSNIPRWVTAVVQALKCKEGEEDSAAAFWEIAADDGNIIAGVEFARLILFPTTAISATAEATTENGNNNKQQKALRFLDSGCSAHIPSAMHLVAKLMLLTTATTTSIIFNPSLARRWLERAASLEYAPAIHEMGELFLTVQQQQQRKDSRDDADDDEYLNNNTKLQQIQTVFQPNIVTAMRCFKKASDLGFAESNFSLGKLFLLSLLDDDSEEKIKEKISRAQYFLNQYLSRRRRDDDDNNNRNNSNNHYEEALQLLENCAKKLQ